MGQTFTEQTTKVEEVLLAKGFLNKDSFNVGAGGQTIFNTVNEIGNDFMIFEDGIASTKTFNLTGPKQLTSTTTVLEGTIVDIIY